jgi:hypothetical protein
MSTTRRPGLRRCRWRREPAAGPPPPLDRHRGTAMVEMDTVLHGIRVGVRGTRDTARHPRRSAAPHGRRSPRAGSSPSPGHRIGLWPADPRSRRPPLRSARCPGRSIEAPAGRTRCPPGRQGPSTGRRPGPRGRASRRDPLSDRPRQAVCAVPLTAPARSRNSCLRRTVWRSGRAAQGAAGWGLTLESAGAGRPPYPARRPRPRRQDPVGDAGTRLGRPPGRWSGGLPPFRFAVMAQAQRRVSECRSSEP